MADLLQVVVLARHAQALLRIGGPGIGTGNIPRKMSLNWFIPALVNINVGSFFTTIGADGTITWSFPAKKSRKA